jgi:hypothetical protein
MVYPVVVVSTIFVFIGVLCILFPDFIRRYDDRLTRLVKDREGYKTALMLYGAVFIIAGIFIGVVGFFGLLQ